VINNLDDSSEFPGGSAVVEKDNAANFDEPVKYVRISSAR
jgi:hypothetical protein